MNSCTITAEQRRRISPNLSKNVAQASVRELCAHLSVAHQREVSRTFTSDELLNDHRGTPATHLAESVEERRAIRRVERLARRGHAASSGDLLRASRLEHHRKRRMLRVLSSVGVTDERLRCGSCNTKRCCQCGCLRLVERLEHDAVLREHHASASGDDCIAMFGYRQRRALGHRQHERAVQPSHDLRNGAYERRGPVLGCGILD